MDFSFSAEQEAMRDTVRSFLRRHVDGAVLRAAVDERGHHDAELWKRMGGELGLHGLHLPEEHGGQGWGMLELAVVCEELGAALAPSPFFASTVLAGTALATAGDAGRSVLGSVATGDAVATVAIAEPGRGWDLAGPATLATPTGDGVTLLGTKVAVPYGAVADAVVVSAVDGATGELVLALAEAGAAGLETAWIEGLDLVEPMARLTFDGARALEVARGPAATAALERTWQVGSVMLACSMAGGARACLDGAVRYSLERKQFGRIIASFQSIKHLCVDMLVEVELATAAAHYAAWALEGTEGDERVRTSSMAKAMASDAYLFVADAALHVHGGIGFTWEHDAHLHLRRARACGTFLGTPRRHRDAFLRAAGL